MILLSVVIPHYNNYDGLKRLVNSIPPLDNIEIIVVDDSSPRSVVEKIVNSEIKQRIILYQNSSSNSAGTCRNIGIDKSSGKYLIFADADDFFDTNSLQMIFDKIESLNDDITFFPCYSEKEWGSSSSKRGKSINNLMFKFIKNKNKKNEMLIRTRMHHPFSKIFKRDFVLRNGIYFDGTLYSNDVMFSLKTGLLAASINALPQKFYIITSTEGSLTKTVNSESVRVRDDVYKEYIIYLNNYKNRNSTSGPFIKNLGLRFLLRSVKIHKNFKKIKNDLKFLKDNKIPVFL